MFFESRNWIFPLDKETPVMSGRIALNTMTKKVELKNRADEKYLALVQGIIG